MAKIHSETFYLLETFHSLKDGSNVALELFNPIATKVNPVYEENDDSIWGVVNWYDPANQQFHVILVKNEPEIREKDIIIVDEDNILYKFRYITTEIYDSHIRDLLMNAPNFTDDESVQNFLNSSMP